MIRSLVVNFHTVVSFDSGPEGLLSFGFGLAVFKSFSELRILELKVIGIAIFSRSLYHVKAGDIHESASGEALRNPLSPDERRLQAY